MNSTEQQGNAAMASATLAPGEASIGRTGRNSSSPTERNPASPPEMAISDIRVRSPDSISARRATVVLTPAALATASAITPASAP